MIFKMMEDPMQCGTCGDWFDGDKEESEICPTCPQNGD